MLKKLKVKQGEHYEKILNMNEQENNKEHKNCKEVKISELSERIAKLEKTVEKQNQQDKQTKLLSKVIFWGAVASGFNAIFGLVSMITNWIEKIKR